MNATSFGGKTRLVFSVRAVKKRSSDHLSNFSPAPRAVLTFPGSLPLQPDICGVCAPATGPRHRRSDRSVGEASAVVGGLPDRDRALAGAEVRHMDAQYGAE